MEIETAITFAIGIAWLAWMMYSVGHPEQVRLMNTPCDKCGKTYDGTIVSKCPCQMKGDAYGKGE